MWWAKAGDWSAKAVDQFLGAQAAHNANRTNIRLARENRDWQSMMFDKATELDNTSVQRHVADLRAAGLNPMLGYTGQASTPSQPSGSVARVEPTYRSGSESANPRIMEAMMMESVTQKTRAEARLTNAQASLEEAKVPHGAQSAQQGVDKVQEEIVRLGQDIERMDIQIKSERELRPLLVRAQQLSNDALEMGLSRKELEKNVADMFKVPFQYGETILRKLNEVGSSVGTGFADFVDYLRELKKSVPDFYFDPDTKRYERVR